MTLAYEMIPMPEAGTDEWLEIRKQYIGASESAAALGLSEWQSQQYLHGTKLGLVEPKETTIAMQLGNAVEPVIISEFMKRTGKQGEKPSFMAVSKEYPWMSANMDWFSFCRTEGADAKNSIATGKWGDEDSDEYPLDYFFQCQHTMVVVPTLKCMWLAALLPFYKMNIYQVFPDPEIQAKIIEGTKKFYDLLKSGVQPAFDVEHPLALDEVKRRYPTTEDKCVVLHESLNVTVRNLEDVKAQIKQLDLRKKSLQATLLDHMGDARTGEIGKSYVLKRTLISPKPYTAHPSPYIKLTISKAKKELS